MDFYTSKTQMGTISDDIQRAQNVIRRHEQNERGQIDSLRNVFLLLIFDDSMTTQDTELHRERGNILGQTGHDQNVIGFWVEELLDHDDIYERRKYVIAFWTDPLGDATTNG